MDFIVTSSGNAGQTREKYTLRSAAISRFERLFGGRFEAAIAAHYERAERMPSRDEVLHVEATNGDTRVVFRTRT